MRILIAAVGRMKAGAERDLVARYLDRAGKLGRTLGIPKVDVIEIPEARAPRAADRMAEEAAALSALLPERAIRVVLDERGRTMPSADFSARLARWRDEGAPALAFLIGGADGHGPALRESADLLLSFGAMTWPHQLVRVMAAEQIYRALTVIAGHPYHRE